MLKVLLVDDSPLAIEGLKKHIPWETTGCECVGTALNGQEALEMVNTLNPDIVITDVRMPIMDGLELCSILHDQKPGIKLVILSAYDDFAYAKNALLYGVKDYLLKPIDYPKIMEIAHMLHAMSEKEKKRIANLTHTMNPETEQWLFSLLTGDDDQALTDALRQFLAGKLEGDFSSPPPAVLTLVRLLYTYLRRLEISVDALGKTLDQSIAQIHRQTSPQQQTNYIIGEYQQLYLYLHNRRNTSADKLVASIKKYIQDHFSDPELSANTICQKFRISQSYLCHIYKECENQNITACITQLRIDEAVRLLLNTSTPINDIALKVGYSDPHYFTKIFKKNKGVSPSDMRKMTQEW